MDHARDCTARKFKLSDNYPKWMPAWAAIVVRAYRNHECDLGFSLDARMPEQKVHGMNPSVRRSDPAKPIFCSCSSNPPHSLIKHANKNIRIHDSSKKNTLHYRSHFAATPPHTSTRTGTVSRYTKPKCCFSKSPCLHQRELQRNATCDCLRHSSNHTKVKPESTRYRHRHGNCSDSEHHEEHYGDYKLDPHHN